MESEPNQYLREVAMKALRDPGEISDIDSERVKEVAKEIGAEIKKKADEARARLKGKTF